MSSSPAIQAQQSAPPKVEGGEVLAFPARDFVPGRFGHRSERERWSLIVDLSAEEIGPRWFRGAASLALLCTGALLLAPGLEPFGASASPVPAGIEGDQFGSLAIHSIPVEQASASPDELAKAKGLQVGTSGGLKRVSGDVAEGLYWSLRGAGASPATSAAFLQALSSRIDMAEVSPFDRFEFVVSERPESPGALLYAGLDRAMGDDVQLLRWTVGGRSDWFDADPQQRSSSSVMMAPVPGRITSRFGSRVHPILRFRRFHGGVDFAGGWGTPIVAAADGQVVGAGWSGGYGRQVRVAHGGGVTTSYSHMSNIAAAPGMAVRQGQVIGHVGSSGLSTGPHLHFEVRVGGQAVDPLSVRLASRRVIEGQELAAFKARLKQLLSIEQKKG
jgi:murein DD-endopeptidase MepM/ murein hydrolase activator NlpD